MDIRELMEIDVHNLAEKQHEAVKRHTINVLENIISLIEEEKYQQVQNELVYSPAGDCMGTDTYHINFAYRGGEYDLSDILDELVRLKRSAQ